MLAADSIALLIGSFHNVDEPEDVNVDGAVNVVDAFIAVDELRHQRPGGLLRMVDVDASGDFNFKDALHIISRLRNGVDETTVPLEARINNLTAAIEHGIGNFDPSRAQRLLERLEARLDSHNGENGDAFDAEQIVRRFRRLDVDRDAALSVEELSLSFEGEGLAETFGDFEDDVTVDQFVEGVITRWHELRERLGDPADAESAFDFLDANDDGGLTEDEVPTEAAWQALLPADENNDQSLSEEELRDYAHWLAEEQVDSLFDLLDSSDDQLIEPDEVGSVAWLFLRTVDENESGDISVDEFRQLPELVLSRFRNRD